MPNINVSHVEQNGPTHCGVACLEMVYKYFSIDREQDDIWQIRKTQRPNNPSEFFMTTDNMIRDLIDNGFTTIVGQFFLEKKLLLGSLKRLLNNGTPIIACIQWEVNPVLGHFVVIIGVENDQIIYLNPETDSIPKTENTSSFVNRWKATGTEVIGGQFIAMGNNINKLKVNRLHLNSFFVPQQLKSFCLESVNFDS